MKNLFAFTLIICLIMTLSPTMAYASSSTNSTELVAVELWAVKSIADEDGRITLKKGAPEPSAKEILVHSNGYPIIFAEKHITDTEIQYRMLGENDKIICTDSTITLSGRIRSFEKNRYGMYGGQNDAFTAFVYYVSSQAIGTYTFEYEESQAQLNIQLPDFGYYKEPEATIENQIHGNVRYDADKENVIYMIVKNPESYYGISFKHASEEFKEVLELEQLGNHGEICKITIHQPIKQGFIICLRKASNGETLQDGEGFYTTERPKKAVLSSVKSSKAHSISIKWKKQENAVGYQVYVSTDSKFKKNVKKYTVSGISKTIKGLKSGEKYYVKVRAYSIAEGKYYGPWSKYRTITCK